MRVLFVGGIYPVEFSLFKEAENNPNLSVLFCCDGASMPDVLPIVKPHIVSSKSQVDAIRNDFVPDITIFRTWCSSASYISLGDVLWHQEIFPTMDDGTKVEDNTPQCLFAINAYQSKPRADALGGVWFPYCVSKKWGRIPIEKDIPVMVATSFPSNTEMFKLKKKSMDILVKPIIEYDPSIIQFFNGYFGGGDNVPYLSSITKRSFPPTDAVKNICRAKIYISPTSIWNDNGCVSYKTVEAMACGVCVMTNNYPGMEDVFGKDGDTIVYANSPQEALDKVLFYLKNDGAREKLANRGYEFIHETYSWEKHLTRLLSKLR